ncbi:fluoride efflux transporter CrcB [Tomitella fengzijianii]|uniref:Fluoride-specific ion channel FluC n=1 Tax=Tomitella fengzijianii TaxID=2597660 RepID=A0A516X037_9ACTN|nr:fluoride efflux transporter CrcB [Tomitella fengzijianii]QDQ96435.1 fluoride efflux transporter CrcB [Tomitella fengzijianii]
MTTLWVALAGGGGATARFLLDGAITSRRAWRFPWATLAINVLGSLLLGYLTGLAMFHDAPTGFTVIAGVGFCGGFTTFSAASVETVRLLETRRYAAGLANLGGTLVVTAAAAALGLWLASVS